jgi:proline iminopeptidase
MQESPRHFLRRCLGFSALAAALAVSAWVLAAYVAYNRVSPAQRPCRGCSAPARAVRVNGFDLYYLELGLHSRHPPIVALHGGPGQSSLTFKGSLDRLAPDYRVVYFDQRGSGNSEVKPDAALYTIEHLVDDLEVLRRDVVQAERIVLLAHSFGGAVAQRYAIAHPDRVSALILVGSVRINNGIGSRWFWRIFGPALYSTALGFPPADAGAADAWAEPTSTDPDLTARLFDSRRTDIFTDVGYASFAPWREIVLSATGRDFDDELRRLAVPTLFMYGEADSRYTGREVADELCGRVPRCEAIGFPQSGHWPFLEEPARFERILRRFLDAR